MYTTPVVCLVSGIWGSLVYGVEVGGMWRKWYVGIIAMRGKWHWRSTVCWVSLRSVL